MPIYDAIIIGAGAAGLYCAATAAKRHKHILVLEHNASACQKLLVSGGGRCNFTNLNSRAENYLCQNPHFVKYALSQFTPEDFLQQIQQHRIAYIEKKDGQLFCQHSAADIANMLLTECQQAGVEILYQQKIHNIDYQNGIFKIHSHNIFKARKLVIATGALSYPRLGASDFGYQIGKQFGLKIIPPCPALVPLWYRADWQTLLADLSATSVPAQIAVGKKVFCDDLLFTHKGLSGPVILQASSYLTDFKITINLLPQLSLQNILSAARKSNGNKKLSQILAPYLPKKLIQLFLRHFAADCQHLNMADLNQQQLSVIENLFHQWQPAISKSAGFKKAEVTKGGIDTNAINAKTMSCKNNPDLFFIGEVLDVTGELGGHNFQWAWASAYTGAQHI